MKIKILFIVLLLSVSPATPASPAPAALPASPSLQTAVEKFLRTELYFGMNIPGGGIVTEEDWSKFLADEVTPKFPDGFTVVEGYGQFKGADGKIVKEKSRVLILLYAKKSRGNNDPKIEEIRAAYKKAFRQESVLRMDFTQTVRVSF